MTCITPRLLTGSISAVIAFALMAVTSPASALGPWDDRAYQKIHKWDFTGMNRHCVEFDFESGDFEAAGLSTKRLVASYSAAIETATRRAGDYSARFELRPGDRVSGGWRAELRDLNNAVPGSTVWYSISSKIPKDFPNESGNSFVLIQWHDQKVPWNSPEGHSPPLAARYRDGRLDITLRHAFEGQKDGENGREIILYSHPGLERGAWHDFIYQVRWSAYDDPDRAGMVKAWLNGSQVVDYHGPVGYFDDLGPYVKFGIYARNDVDEPHVLYHDEYHRGDDYSTVCITCDIPELTKMRQ